MVFLISRAARVISRVLRVTDALTRTRRLAFAQLLVTSALAVISGQACAGNPNTDAADSVAYEVDQGWVTTSLESASTSRWFAYGEVGGHSYCLETATGSLSPIAIDTRIDVYSDANGTTPLTVNGTAVANDVALGEPIYVDGARACYIASGLPTSSAVRLAKISAPTMAGGDTGYVRFRVVETTLFAPSWYASMPSVGSRPDYRYTTYFVISNRLSGSTINTRWAAAGSVDTNLSFLHLLERYRAEVSKG